MATADSYAQVRAFDSDNWLGPSAYADVFSRRILYGVLIDLAGIAIGFAAPVSGVIGEARSVKRSSEFALSLLDDPSVDEQARDAIAHRKIYMGMDSTHLLMSWGAPGRVVRDAEGMDTYVYARKTKVFCESGIITGWTDDTKPWGLYRALITDENGKYILRVLETSRPGQGLTPTPF